MRSLVFSLVVLTSFACTDSDDKNASSEKTDGDVDARSPTATPGEEDSFQNRDFLVEGADTRHCIQIRSFNDDTVAKQTSAAVTAATKLDTHFFAADLGARGMWTRLCVGAYLTVDDAKSAADALTGEGGALRPFMDDVKPGQAAYLLKERPAPSSGLDDKLLAAVTALPFHVGRVKLLPIKSGNLVLVSARDDAAPNGVVLDGDGRAVAIFDAPPPGCTVCAGALARHRPHATIPLLAARLSRDGSPELIVVETFDDGSRMLSVLSTTARPLRRVGGLWIGKDDAERAAHVRVSEVEIDGGPTREILVLRQDVTMRGSAVCSSRLSSTAQRLTATGLVEMDLDDPKKGEPLPFQQVIEILDDHGDHARASRLCARLAGAKDARVQKMCLGRVTSLARNGHVVDAVNAGGLMSEASSSLRPQLAAALLTAAAAIDAHKNRTVVPDDCSEMSILTSKKPPLTPESFADVRRAASLRVDLGELHDAVFVTARRDFDVATPFAISAERWLAAVGETLPARKSAIEALLVVPGAK